MRITSKRNIGLKRVYDITVADNHNFIANDVVAHNSGARQFCLEAKPDSIDELAALTAIYRPGPLKANVHKLYVKAKQDAANVKYDHPIIEDVLGSTFGFLCLAGDTKVKTVDGEDTIENIVKMSQPISVLSYDPVTGDVVHDRITQFHDQGLKETIIVETEDGEIELTPDHIVYTSRGKVPAGELRVDDEIIMLDTNP